MWSIIKHYRSLVRHTGIHRELRRFFVSDSFSCEEAWAKRLKSPILQKVSLQELFYELDNKLDQTQKVSPVDVDIFINAINDGDHFDEMEDLVHRLRLSTEAANIMDSTHHAFVRNYFAHGDANELLRILNDRLNYGIFLDDYCAILLMNHFIKNKDFANASKVAALQMLQEDFSNDMVKYMSLFSCHSYLLSPSEWGAKDNVEPENEDDEEVKVRVKYLRNPFFDDHFDLEEPDKLIGKTLSMISDQISDSFKSSYKLLGLVLHGKLKESGEYLSECLNNDLPIYQSTISLLENNLEKIISLSEGKENFDLQSVNNIKNGLDILKGKPQCMKDDLLDVLQEKLKKTVSANEESLINAQVKIYDEWENKRELELRKELEELKKKEVEEEIQKKKEQLLKREEELFFFENENELELKIDRKWTRYPPKWPGKKKKKRPVDEEYVPPELSKPKYKSL